MDITPAGGQVDLYWPLLSNREAIAGEHRRSISGEWKRPEEICCVKDRLYLLEEIGSQGNG